MEKKKNEIAEIGVKKILNELNNDPSPLVVKALHIRNKEGNIAAEISSDDGGDGFIKVNSEKGEKRYLLSLTGD